MLQMPSVITANFDLAKDSPIAGYKAPDASVGREWWQSPSGRVGTRLFSRGVMGSLFFAGASVVSERALKNYNPEVGVGAELYGEANHWQHKFVRGMAYVVDQTIAPLIRGVVGLFTKDEQKIANSTIFRDTRYWGRTVDGVAVRGRSLGHEYADVVFNFAMASAGDAMGRNFAQLIDPHKDISWLEDGKFNGKKFINSQFRAAWKIISLNSGEDLFGATIPYLYTMKWQRNFMETRLGDWGRGFKHVFDNGNTAAFKVNDQGQITGNYYWQNMLDYQLRFTHYNIFTLMYREMYNSVGGRLNAWIKKGESPLDDLPKTPGEAARDVAVGAANFVRYLGRSIIKGYILMTPTVPFFSLLRVPQAKYRALAINPERGPVMIASEMLENPTIARALTPHYHDNLKPEFRNTDGNTIYRAHGDDFEATEQKLKLHFWDEQAPNASLSNPYFKPMDEKTGMSWFNPYDTKEITGYKEDVVQRASNAMGSAAYRLSRNAYDWLVDVRYGLGLGNSGSGERFAAKRRQSDLDLKDLTLAHFNSALAYTPYFAAKTEFAELWDKRETDNAIDRMLRGLGHFNPGEFVAGVGDTFNALRHPGKTAGLSSVYGTDQSTTVGWFPWSEKTKRSQEKAAEKAQPQSFTERVGTKPAAKAAPREWQDREYQGQGAVAAKS